MKKRSIIVAMLLMVSLLANGCGAGGSGTTANTNSNSTNESKVTYPERNINGSIGFGAGGVTDQISRLIAPGAEDVLGKTIVLTNRTGAQGSVATQYVNDKDANGYDLLFDSEVGALYNVMGTTKLNYLDNFEPIILSISAVPIVVVPADSPYKTIDDLLAAAKAKPGTINMGISGVAGIPYIASAEMKQLSGATFNPVVYDGDGPSITALLGGQIDITVLSVGTAKQYIDNGDFIGLAIMANKKSDALPDVPVMSELHPEYKDMLNTTAASYGVFVKKGTPQEIIEKLTKAFVAGYNTTEFQNYCKEFGFNTLGLTGADAKAYIEKFRNAVSWIVFDNGDAAASPETFGIPRP